MVQVPAVGGVPASAPVRADKSLGMPTIAEGMEHIQTMKELAQGGAEYGQAFYFGKAMPAGEADRLVQNAPTRLTPSTAA